MLVGASDITDWLGKDRTDIGRINVSCLEAFGALRAICQVFLRNRPRSCIERSGTLWAQLASSLSEEAKQTQTVETLHVEDRALLVPAGLKIIDGWPDSFVRFANESGVSRTHFNGTECLQPQWMNEVINSKLAKQNRNVTDAVLATALTTLTQQLERIPTKTELRRHLAWQGEKGLGKHFVKRTQATAAEWHQFLKAIADTELRLAHKARSKNAFSCELAVLLLCLMNDGQINSFVDVERQDLCNLLASRREQLRKSETELQLETLKIESTLTRVPVAPLKPAPISTRQVRKRLLQLMSGLPSELARDVRVFKSPACICPESAGASRA